MADAAVDALRAARTYLERGWCQRAEARDGDGRPAHPDSPQARSWSLTGAIYAASRFDGSPERRVVHETAVAMLAEVLGAGPAAWNDTPGRTWTQTLAALETVLRLAEGASWYGSEQPAPI